jgi:amino acid transporter
MKKNESKKNSINKDIIYRGEPIEVADKSYEIKKSWKKFFKILFILLIVSAFIISVFMFRRYPYYKEYFSKEWYLAPAYLDNSHAYLVSTYDGDIKTEITKYTRFYSYTGRDGNTYFHQLKNNDTEGTKGEELLIWVSVENNAKTLTFQDYSDENLLMYGLIIVLLVPYIILSLIKLITLYMKRHKLNKEYKKENKDK